MGNALEGNEDDMCCWTQFCVNVGESPDIGKGSIMKKADSRLGRQIAALKRMKDENIDLSDIPETADWSKVVVGKFYRPILGQFPKDPIRRSSMNVDIRALQVGERFLNTPLLGFQHKPSMFCAPAPVKGYRQP